MMSNNRYNNEQNSWRWKGGLKEPIPQDWVSEILNKSIQIQAQIQEQEQKMSTLEDLETIAREANISVDILRQITRETIALKKQEELDRLQREQQKKQRRKQQIDAVKQNIKTCVSQLVKLIYVVSLMGGFTFYAIPFMLDLLSQNHKESRPSTSKTQPTSPPAIVRHPTPIWRSVFTPQTSRSIPISTDNSPPNTIAKTESIPNNTQPNSTQNLPENEPQNQQTTESVWRRNNPLNESIRRVELDHSEFADNPASQSYTIPEIEEAPPVKKFLNREEVPISNPPEESIGETFPTSPQIPIQAEIEEEPQVIHLSHAEVWLDRNGSGSGTLKSNQFCKAALIDFRVYDRQGNPMGYAFDIQQNLPVGESWAFNAMALHSGGNRFEFDKFECSASSKTHVQSQK